MPYEGETKWLSVKELMAFTGLGRTKCYELIASGEIEAIKAGRAIRVERTSIEEWARRNRYIDVVCD
ncbi:MAG: helix-turn-helix domain-containing protein [Rubrobacteraceae bacterium]|nr:helix-turn-helix domain-containing protein [Actinomycetota bacterium]